MCNSAPKRVYVWKKKKKNGREVLSICSTNGHAARNLNRKSSPAFVARKRKKGKRGKRTRRAQRGENRRDTAQKREQTMSGEKTLSKTEGSQRRYGERINNSGKRILQPRRSAEERDSAPTPP